jgi:hypothetical protein
VSTQDWRIQGVSKCFYCGQTNVELSALYLASLKASESAPELMKKAEGFSFAWDGPIPDSVCEKCVYCSHVANALMQEP